jgi:hypothetical protein
MSVPRPFAAGVAGGPLTTRGCELDSVDHNRRTVGRIRPCG